MRSIEPTEHQIQCAIVEWANNTFVDHPAGRKVCLGSYLIKIPNEGKRSLAYGKKMKKEGLKKGASDLFLAIPLLRSRYFLDFYFKCGLWLEIKKKGKKPTNEQLEFLENMRSIGYESQFKDSVDEGIQAIKDYLGIR